MRKIRKEVVEGFWNVAGIVLTIFVLYLLYVNWLQYRSFETFLDDLLIYSLVGLGIGFAAALLDPFVKELQEKFPPIKAVLMPVYTVGGIWFLTSIVGLPVALLYELAKFLFNLIG